MAHPNRVTDTLSSGSPQTRNPTTPGDLPQDGELRVWRLDHLGGIAPTLRNLNGYILRSFAHSAGQRNGSTHSESGRASFELVDHEHVHAVVSNGVA